MCACSALCLGWWFIKKVSLLPAVSHILRVLFFMVSILLQFAVVEFSDLTGQSVHVVPTAWLDEDDGSLVCWWPADSWTDSKLNKAIENCIVPDDSFEKHTGVRVLHTYSKN